MTDPVPQLDPRRRLWRRLLPLALLGSALALVVVQLGKAVRHDVAVSVSLAPEWAGSLDRLEMQVGGPGGEVASVAIFRFDDRHRPGSELNHVLSLPNDDYSVVFKLYRQGGDPRVVHRSLRVDGSATVRYEIP